MPDGILCALDSSSMNGYVGRHAESEAKEAESGKGLQSMP